MKPDSAAINVRNLIAACAAITVFGFAFGLSYPLLSLIMESKGYSTDMIGINSAMMPIGILLFSSVIPVAAKRLGSRNVAIIAALLSAVLMLSYKVFDTLAAWFIIRLIHGMTVSTLFVLSEAWIVRFAGDRHRGKVVAIYASILSASFAAGPAILGWIGIHGWLPFVIGAVVMLIGVLPLGLVREDRVTEPEETQPSRILDFAPKAPMLLLAVAIFSIFDAAALALLPVYGLQNGLDAQTSALVLSALIAGNMLFQLPLGWLADKFDKRAVMTWCSVVTVAAMLVLPFVMASALMWPVIVVAGTAGYGVYTVALAALGDRFTGEELVTGSAAFAVVWGIGALLGSTSAGWAMTGFGPHGLPVYIAITYVVLAVGMGYRHRQISRQH